MVDRTKFKIYNVDKEALQLNIFWKIKREDDSKIVYMSTIKNPLALFKGNAKLFLFLEYNKKDRMHNLIVIGSIRKWYFGKNVRRDINKNQLQESLFILAKVLNIPEEKVFNANITKMELGATLVLKPVFNLLRKGFISYPKYLKKPFKTSDYFGDKRTSSFSIILYNKLDETCKKNNKKLFRAVRSKDKIYFCRFEISLNKISKIKFFNAKSKTFNQLLENWDIVVEKVLKTADKIKFVDSMSDFKIPLNVTRTTPKNKKRYRLIQSKGLANIFNEISNEPITSDEKKNKKLSYKTFCEKHSMGTYKHLKLEFMEKLKVKLMTLS